MWRLCYVGCYLGGQDSVEVLSKGLVTSAWQDYHFALGRSCRRDGRLAHYRAAAKLRLVQALAQGEGRTNLKCGLVRSLE